MHQQRCVVAAVTAPTAPGCVEMNAAGRFSCLCCDAVKGILGKMWWEVGESHLQSRLGKVGGSGADRVDIRGFGLYMVRCELCIGFRLGQLLMTCYKCVRTQVGTSTGIEKRHSLSAWRGTWESILFTLPSLSIKDCVLAFCRLHLPCFKKSNSFRC